MHLRGGGVNPLLRKGLAPLLSAVALFISFATTATAESSHTSHSVASVSAASNWPQYLDGPSHSSYNGGATSISPSAIEAGNLQPIWRWYVPSRPTKSGWNGILASPTVVDGIIYVGAEDGGFYAVDEATQRTLWSRFLGIDPQYSPYPCTNGVNEALGIISTAAVVKDPVTGKLMVYVFSPDGRLYALNAATGATVWAGLVDTPSTTENNYYSWGSPLVVNGKVYIGISSNCDTPLVPAGLVEFNQATGSRVATWHSLPQGDVGASIWSSAAALPDGSILVTTGNGYTTTEPLYDESIVRLSGSTLHVLDAWQVPASQQIGDGDFGASPSLFSATIKGVATPMVGACNKNGLYYAFAQDDLSGGPVWQTRITRPYVGGNGECIAASIWTGRALIVSGGDQTSINGKIYSGSVRSLNPANGEPLWQTGLPGSVDGTPTEDGAGVIAAGLYGADSPSDQGLYLLDASTGRVIGRIPTPGSNDFAEAIFTGKDLLVVENGSYPGLTDYEITTPGPPITSVTPRTIALGATRTITITGKGFSTSSRVFVSGVSIIAGSVKRLSSTALSVKVTVASSAFAGYRNITVIESSSSRVISSTCYSCLIVGSPI